MNEIHGVSITTVSSVGLIWIHFRQVKLALDSEIAQDFWTFQLAIDLHCSSWFSLYQSPASWWLIGFSSSSSHSRSSPFAMTAAAGVIAWWHMVAIKLFYWTLAYCSSCHSLSWWLSPRLRENIAHSWISCHAKGRTCLDCWGLTTNPLKILGQTSHRQLF